MLRSNDAKNWKSNAFGQEAVDKLIKLTLVAERYGA
jgi:hypothetical protein